MKAIQIRTIEAKPSRLKAWSDTGVNLYEKINYSKDTTKQALFLAEKYIEEMHWDGIVSRFGVLPNGDFVATIE